MVTVPSVFGLTVDVSPQVKEETGVMESKDETLKRGFAQAVTQEALDLLPGDISETRTFLLHEFLGRDAGDFILSYSELGSAGSGDSLRYLLDVSVNRKALKRRLQEMGVYYSVNDTRLFDLTLSHADPDTWETLIRLETLSGLEYQSEAMPRLVLEKSEDEKPVWRGILETEKTTYTGENKELADLWFDLWGNWFLEGEQADSVVETAELIVEGWYTPDGVHAFDRTLKQWDGRVEGAELKRMTMTQVGLTAVWGVKVLDKNRLEETLDAYIPSRGLKYSLRDSR